MSRPFHDYADPIHGALIEITSAISSLNMQPEPILGADTPGAYICETDANVKHAIEHLHAAMIQLRKVEK